MTQKPVFSPEFFFAENLKTLDFKPYSNEAQIKTFHETDISSSALL